MKSETAMELTSPHPDMRSMEVVPEAQRILDIDAQLEALGAQPQYLRVASRSFIATSVLLMLWGYVTWGPAEILVSIALVYALIVWVGGLAFQIAEEHDRRAQLEGELDTMLRRHEQAQRMGAASGEY